jgi:hypothetical protein
LVVREERAQSRFSNACFSPNDISFISRLKYPCEKKHSFVLLFLIPCLKVWSNFGGQHNIFPGIIAFKVWVPALVD